MSGRRVRRAGGRAAARRRCGGDGAEEDVRLPTVKLDVVVVSKSPTRESSGRVTFRFHSGFNVDRSPFN
jgi:hypothetical protein